LQNYGVINFVPFLDHPVDTLLVRPEAIACGADLSFTHDVFKKFFSTRDLRDAWADWREILHDGQY